MRTSVSLVAVVLLAGVISAAAQDVPGAPATAGLPSINSVRPGIVQAGSGTATVTIYGIGLDPTGSLPEVLWNGTSLGPGRADEAHPGTRLVIDVDGALLANPGDASLAVRQGPVESNAVTIRITADPPPPCLDPSDPVFPQKSAEQICGYALGELPTLEIVPRHVWYPFVAAPAGGIVRVVNRDTMAEFGNHAVTNTTVQDRTPFVSDMAPSGVQGRYFDLQVNKPPEGTSDGVEGFLRVPADLEPGATVPFFCSSHSNDMVTPLGGITVQ